MNISLKQNKGPRNKLRKHIQLIFYKGIKEIQWRKDSLFNKLDILMQKTKQKLLRQDFQNGRVRVSINLLLHKSNKKTGNFFSKSKACNNQNIYLKIPLPPAKSQ